jgi:hypothetical protein
MGVQEMRLESEELWILLEKNEFRQLPLISRSCKQLLSNQFPDGLPKQAAAYALKSVLEVLVYLHDQGVILK